METTLGLSAAGLSPMAMTLGFIVWDDQWKGSPYSLNCFKCSLTGTLFLIISLCVRKIPIHSWFDLTMISVSSLIGIVIGDNTWLMALKLIGAKKVILIDSLKPFLAAILGYSFLGEPLNIRLFLGILVSSTGILMVSLETKPSGKPSDDTQSQSVTYAAIDYTQVQTFEDGLELDSSTNDESEDYANEMRHSSTGGSSTDNTSMVKPTRSVTSHTSELYGYGLAAINVVFDAFGSLLTKRYGVSYNTFEINLIRFGFAAVVMLAFSGLCCVCAPCVCPREEGGDAGRREEGREDGGREKGGEDGRKREVELASLSRRGNSEKVESSHSAETDFKIPSPDLEEIMDDPDDNSRQIDNEPTVEGQGGEEVTAWYTAWPPEGAMTTQQWLAVATGVLFVTFLCPSLSNYALMIRQIPIGLCLTLTSLGPVYSLPLLWLMRGESITLQSAIGVSITMFGVIILVM